MRKRLQRLAAEVNSEFSLIVTRTFLIDTNFCRHMWPLTLSLRPINKVILDFCQNGSQELGLPFVSLEWL